MPAVGVAGDVPHIVHAGSARRKADLLKFEKAFDHVSRRDFPNLEVCARCDIRVPAAPLLSDIRKTRSCIEVNSPAGIRQRT